MYNIEQARKIKQIPFSWSRKLSNVEFTTLSNTMYEAVTRLLGDYSPFDGSIASLGDSNAELQRLRPVVTTHHNTKLINEWHALRKKILSYIIVTSSDMSRFQIYRGENHDQYGFLHNWIRGYGKRLYDLGICKLTSIMVLMENDYKTEDRFREAIDSCFKREFADMIALNNQIMDAQVVRSIQLTQAQPQRGYVEVRKDVVISWQFFISKLVYQLRKGKDVERLTVLYNLLWRLVTDSRAIVKMRETRRANNQMDAANIAIVDAEPNLQPVVGPEIGDNDMPEVPHSEEAINNDSVKVAKQVYQPTKVMVGDNARMPAVASVNYEAEEYCQRTKKEPDTPSNQINILIKRWDGLRWH